MAPVHSNDERLTHIAKFGRSGRAVSDLAGRRRPGRWTPHFETNCA